MIVNDMRKRLNKHCYVSGCVKCTAFNDCMDLFGEGSPRWSEPPEDIILKFYCLVFGPLPISMNEHLSIIGSSGNQSTKAEANTPDQTLKADAGKPRLSLVPMQILWDVAAVREWATANKYPDPESWRKVEISRYRDALLRHVLRYIDNPDGVDDESGLPHLYHVATNCAFLAELEKRQKGTVSLTELEKGNHPLMEQEKNT